MEQTESFDRRKAVQNSKYICGVVEGFYGRPWTPEQRKHLFKRQNQLGLTTYLYAPKDDIKHRSLWRELYNNEEMTYLRNLVESAKDNNVNFVYAISPGKDILYSSDEEMDTLKNKLDQVRSVGCDSFAVLFDDIEVQMQDEDQKQFTSFAHAQVHIANTIFKYLNTKTFMFCPTEYCESRAVPTLESSQYLNTIGEQLAGDIHIMWTGPRVISRYLTVEHLARVGSVMRRKPLIWDNLHANDYDLKKIFMGPMMHRSVKIKEFTSGLLSNPNGRYEANFVPFHTLSDWNAADRDLRENESGISSRNGVILNIDCNTETIYVPEVSLVNAVSTWIDEFITPSVTNAPQPPQLTADVAGYVPDRRECVWLLDLPETHGVIRPEPVMPAEIATENIIQSAVAPEEPVPSELNSLAAEYSQPMETEDPVESQEDESMVSVDEDVSAPVVLPGLATTAEEIRNQRLSLLCATCEMYYLPFENGPRVQSMFKDFRWLMQNASVMKKSFKEIETLDPLQSEWLVKYDGVNEFLTSAIDSFFFITQAPNKAILSEIVPYAFDAHSCCVLLIAVARWMMQGNALDNPENNLFEDFGSTEERWINQNGFRSETMRVLNVVDDIEVLLSNKIFLPLCMFCFDIRPFTIADKEYISGMVTVMLTTNQELLHRRATNFADRNIIPFLCSGAEHNFLCEKVDETGHKPVCYASAHFDGTLFSNFLITYKEKLKEKYRGLIEDSKIGSTKLTDEYIEFIQNSQTPMDIEEWYPKIPDQIFENYPAWVETYFGMDASDAHPMRKVIQVVAVTLAMNGSRGYFLTVAIDDIERQKYFLELGLTDLGLSICQRFRIFGQTLRSTSRQSSTSE
ncbi:protein O-GlcNAcase [Caenorhabditis elegans]|uniref:protein O-GlcNAcase n=1 Tax=Caenorhabditis elegans TaxID=6239 RepID=Q1WBU8_CAEEL|nr:Protein O-GlcNAcase [Caenorhabditis elegans]ABD85014.1 OGA-1b [Caenorhabditis elegans]CCD68586.1 Protein O-GlcNAcase [Caenorhabditis elegans]|eukprot:NP_001123183.1 O-GlcNAc selective N-Acetyl-beta-D-glucosaminidase (O-GlcNAcase) [Caenorhabditis elegans]